MNHPRLGILVRLFLTLFVLLGFNLNNSSAQTTAGVSAGGTVMPDLFTGTMSYAIPIEVPPGRNGMQPGLSLVYQSSRGNGWLGVGWELEVGAIERNIKYGVNYTADDYLLRLAGATVELVFIGFDASNNREYRAKIESSFMRVKKLRTGGWEVTDKTGKRYLFGQTVASRQVNPSASPQIFKWCLDRVEDTDGNYMTFTYVKDQNQIYLDRIDYTGHSTLSATNYVKFYTETRTDAPAMYTLNYSVVMAKRLKTIDVVANGLRQRVYKLSYGYYSSSTGRSLLAGVQLYDKNATVDASGTVTGGNALPASTFTKTYASNSWSNTLGWSTSPYYALDNLSDGNESVVTGVLPQLILDRCFPVFCTPLPVELSG
jgi:hypothetical protein